MKYSELEKLIKQETDCYFHRNGSRHPIWINPETDVLFELSHHKSQEVKKGTLNDILIKSGIKKVK